MIKAKKQLGQNWLKSQEAIDQIIQALDIQDASAQRERATSEASPPWQGAERSEHILKEHIIEVGPGLGALTTEIAKTEAHITAVELDKELLAPLTAQLKKIRPNLENIEIVNKSILEFELPQTPYKVVGNLPYYITSPIISFFLKQQFMRNRSARHERAASEASGSANAERSEHNKNGGNPPQLAVFLVQKEVAERICAQPGDLSMIAINIQTFSQPEIIATVPAKDFEPVPKVDSAIIRITPLKKPAVNCDLKKYFSIISRAFSGKRKKLSNTLPELHENGILEKLGLADKRPQHLTLKEWESIVTTKHVQNTAP